jgi:hypothetical protein
VVRWRRPDPILELVLQRHIHRRLWSIERINRIDDRSTAGRQAVVPEGFRGGRHIRLAVLRDHTEFHDHDPGTGQASAGGFPILSADGEFLMKDIALIGLAPWLFADAIDATRRQATLAKRTATFR